MLTKTRLIIYLLFAFCFNYELRAQSFELTKPQMYADFDSLVSMIEYYNPHLDIYKKAMNLDVIEEIKHLRPEIENINDITGYFMLLRHCVNIIPEAHATILNLKGSTIKEYANIKRNGQALISSNEIQHTIDAYSSIMSKGAEYQNKYYNHMIYLPTSYIDGKYYFTRPLKLVTQQDTVGVNLGDMVTGLNGKAIRDFIKENHRKYINKLKWDIYNNQFYTECFLWMSNFPKDSYPFTSMTIKRKNGVEDTIPFNIHTRYIIGAEGVFKNLEESFTSYDHKPVIWCKDSLLYIKIPSMNPADLTFYETEIARVCKSKNISNVVLDVRNNRGGGDPVWERIVSLITDRPLFRHQTLGVNNRDICQRYLSTKMDSVFSYDDSLLEKQFAIFSKKSWIVAQPDSSSIQCKGKIYVLHNGETYSAANTLVTFALGCDKLIAVGTPNGYLSGYGVNPFEFQLPLSKILFTMHAVIHIPENAPTVDSYLWNSTEITVMPSVKFENIWAEYQMNDFFYQYDFLKEYDPYFQAVIKDINSNGDETIKK